jgi:hypothetical protein
VKHDFRQQPDGPETEQLLARLKSETSAMLRNTQKNLVEPMGVSPFRRLLACGLASYFSDLAVELSVQDRQLDRRLSYSRNAVQDR